MKQTPSLTSPTTDNPYYTTTHWQDSPGNVFGRGPGGKLRNVAQPDDNPHLRAFPQIGRNTKRTHERAAKRGLWSTKIREPLVNKIDLGTENPPPPTIKNHYNIFVMVYELLDTPNRRVLDDLATKLLVHHGGHPFGCKLYLL